MLLNNVPNGTGPKSRNLSSETPNRISPNWILTKSGLVGYSPPRNGLPSIVGVENPHRV
mgnify:FL=1